MISHLHPMRRHSSGLLGGVALGIVVLLVAAGGAQAGSSNFFLGTGITGLEVELARYDEIVISASTVEELDAILTIRELNPDIRIFVLLDFMVGISEGVNDLALDYAEGVEEEWKMVSTTGDYINFWPESFQVNFTDVCPEVEGRVARDYIADFFGERVLPYLDFYDGIYLDCCFESILWMSGHTGEIDLNCDGLADDSNDVLNWVRDGWRDMIDSFRAQEEALLLVGNGSNHLFEHLNGRMLEDFPNSSYGYLTGGLSLLETWRYTTNCDFSIVNSIAEPEDRTARRAGWALAELTDQNVCYDHGPYHHDELQWDPLFDFDLGDPREDMHIEGRRSFLRTFEGGNFDDTIYPPVEWEWCYAGDHTLWEPEDPLTGKWSLRLTVPTDGWQIVYLADLLPTTLNSHAMLSFRYRVEAGTVDGVKLDCSLRGHDGDGSEKIRFDQRTLFPGEEGHFISRGSQTMPARDDWYFYMTTTAPCTIVLDEIRITYMGGAYAEREFDGGFLVHDLGGSGIVLDNFPEGYVPSADPVFEGAWFDYENSGIFVANAGETIFMVQDPDGFADHVWGDDDGSAESNLRGMLGAAYPNPFNPKVTIPFALESSTSVKLDVFDVQGRRLATLADQVFTAGEHTIDWNGQDSRGQSLPSGIYFLRIATPLENEVQKLVMAR
jgi:hypothetical protein